MERANCIVCIQKHKKQCPGKITDYCTSFLPVGMTEAKAKSLIELLGQKGVEVITHSNL